jgi:hypothetical protein
LLRCVHDAKLSGMILGASRQRILRPPTQLGRKNILCYCKSRLIVGGTVS